MYIRKHWIMWDGSNNCFSSASLSSLQKLSISTACGCKHSPPTALCLTGPVGNGEMVNLSNPFDDPCPYSYRTPLARAPGKGRGGGGPCLRSPPSPLCAQVYHHHFPVHSSLSFIPSCIPLFLCLHCHLLFIFHQLLHFLSPPLAPVLCLLLLTSPHKVKMDVPFVISKQVCFVCYVASDMFQWLKLYARLLKKFKAYFRPKNSFLAKRRTCCT